MRSGRRPLRVQDKQGTCDRRWPPFPVPARSQLTALSQGSTCIRLPCVVASTVEYHAVPPSMVKDCWVKAGRRKCARGYACPGFAGRRVPFGKSLNGWPGPHVGLPLPTQTMQQGERHRVQSVLAPRVGCRLSVSVAAHASAATYSYNSLLLPLRSLTSATLYPFSLAPKRGHL